MTEKTTLCQEAKSLQVLGNELIEQPRFRSAELGRWRQGTMFGFSDMAEPPTTVLTTPFPWLPERDASNLVEFSGLQYPVFSIKSAIIAGGMVLRISLGGTMDRSLFADQGACTLDISSRNPDGTYSTLSLGQNGMNSDVGFGYGPVNMLDPLERIREYVERSGTKR
jgi:hypothetical protein